ncbi:hypothetical protein M0R45_027468 [Rubus argutus]|uniref:Uncharacterized protein n=1 Tax=Rubus argutus TaxID=59490 RepID=A0AAW1X361_RUBAR
MRMNKGASHGGKVNQLSASRIGGFEERRGGDHGAGCDAHCCLEFWGHGPVDLGGDSRQRSRDVVVEVAAAWAVVRRGLGGRIDEVKPWVDLICLVVQVGLVELRLIKDGHSEGGFCGGEVRFMARSLYLKKRNVKQGSLIDALLMKLSKDRYDLQTD